MKIVLRLVWFCALAALGFWLWTICFPSAEKVILRKVASLAATATFRSGDGNLTRAGKVQKLTAMFAADAQIIIEGTGQGTRTLTGRDEIRETAMAGFGSLTSLKVEFLDMTVRIGDDRQTADVSCTARVNSGDAKDNGVQEMHFQFKKIDGTWLITRAETVKTLS